MRIPFSPKWNRTWKCLDETRLAAYVDGSLPSADLQRTEAHLSQCRPCREAVAVLVRSTGEDMAVPPAWMARVRHLGGGVDRRAGVPRWAGAFAFALVIVAATAMLLPIHRSASTETAVVAKPAPPFTVPEPDQTRSATPAAGMPAIIHPQNGSAVGRDLHLQWQRLPEAVGYEVRILNDAGDTIWHKSTNSDHLDIPPDAPLVEGQKYFVLIGASLPNGKTVHAKTVSFLVRTQQSR